jgi:hypothetical protein
MGFKAAKFGYLSLALSLLEIAIIWGGRSIALASPQFDWAWPRRVMIETYGLGLPGSFALAITGLLTDAWRILAVLALVLAIVNVVICSLPIAY